MIKAIFFDLANTLVHKPGLPIAIQNALRAFDIELQSEKILRVHRRASEEIHFPNSPDKQFYRQFNAELLTRLSIDPKPEIVQKIFESCLGLSWVPFDDVKALTSISKPLGIGSNWDVTLEEKVAKWFPNQFQWIIGSAAIGIQKPDHGFFEEISQKSGYPLNEIMFLGDSLRLDIQPAADLGIRAVLLDRYDLFESTTFERINNLHQLTDLF